MSSEDKKPVLIVGGGTGGHVFPGLAVAEQLYAQGIPVEWIGTTKGIEARVVPMSNIPLHFLPVSGLRGKSLKTLPKSLYNLLVSQWRALKMVRDINPRSVLGMGGFVAGPSGLAAWLLGIPLLIHEQNAVAGTSNKILARLARRILQGFPTAFSGPRVTTVGNPVRKSIVDLALSQPAELVAEREAELHILVLGGSLGAKPINDIMPGVAQRFADDRRIKIRHQAGKEHAESIRNRYRDLGMKETVVLSFIDDMREAYQWADIVICRAGALTVSELCVAGVPAILIPLPHAIDDHQTKNAEVMIAAEAGYLLPQREMSEATLSGLIKRFLDDKERLKTMSANAKAIAKPDAAEAVARACLEISR